MHYQRAIFKLLIMEIRSSILKDFLQVPPVIWSEDYELTSTQGDNVIHATADVPIGDCPIGIAFDSAQSCFVIHTDKVSQDGISILVTLEIQWVLNGQRGTNSTNVATFFFNKDYEIVSYYYRGIHMYVKSEDHVKRRGKEYEEERQALIASLNSDE